MEIMEAVRYVARGLGNFSEQWIPKAVAIVIVLVTIWVTSSGLSFAMELLQARAIEKAMRKQGIPVVPGRKFREGHAGIMRDKNIEGIAKPQDPNDPHNTVPRYTAFHYESSKKYGPTHVYWRGMEVTLHTQDPAIFKEILLTKFNSFEKTQMHLKDLESLVGKCGLVTASGQAWAHHRRIVNPAFHLDRLKGFVPVMVNTMNEFMGHWLKQVDTAGGCAEIDVSETIKEITSDVISRTAFGSTYGKGKLFFEKNVEMAMYTGARFVNVMSSNYEFLPTASNRKLWKLRKEIKQILEEVVLQARKEKVKLGDQISYGNDLLGLMLTACEELEPSKRLTNDELMDEVKTFFFAGQDTTAVTLVWTFMLLATHQDWQEMAYKEVESVCEGKPLDYESLIKLKIVGNILFETLRLYPVAPWLERQAQEDVQIGDMFFPKGLAVLLDMVALHHDPEQWGPDSQQFNPGRFANGILTASKHTHAFLPFSTGPRNCVGQTFSNLEAKVILATFLREFRFTLSPNYKHEPTRKFLLEPKYGMPLVVTRRK